MRFFLILFLFLITSCSNLKLKNDYNDLEFSNDMTFDEFKLKLEKYSKTKPYPNIDY